MQSPSLVAEKPITQPQILFQNNFLLSLHLSDQTMHFSSIPCLTDFLSLQDPNLLPLICEFYLNPQCFILGKLFAQLCPTLCDPTDCSPPGSSPLSMGFSRQEYWSGLLFRPPGELPDSGIKPGSPTLQADSLPSEPPGKPLFFSSWGCPANGHSALSWVRDT